MPDVALANREWRELNGYFDERQAGRKCSLRRDDMSSRPGATSDLGPQCVQKRKFANAIMSP